MSEEELHMWTGWGREELGIMTNSVAKSFRQSPNRSSELAVIIFWLKLRTNLSYDQIGTLMNYKTPLTDQRKRVSEACAAVQQALIRNFVPKYLGVQHLSRSEALKHQTPYTKTFFGDNVALILDGTYFYIHK
ncbi:unnamed protein product, partial [Didymodactylos carnosus]